jgi:hypothetical protein
VEAAVTTGTIGSKDPQFTTPFVDVDEWRDDPVRHRYVHGGFEGTDTLFSMYFPPEEHYEGRFFQPLMPISGMENAAPLLLGGMMGASIDFAVDSGAYLVESNLGRTVMFPGDDTTLVGYRASAAVARYSRVLAAEMYGDHRPYGYVYGGSGGAYKTLGCIENTVDVWDGAVPFVHGSPLSLPNLFTVQAHAIRILRDVLPQIVDAVEVGGSGDPWTGLSVEQREALAEVTRMGFPLEVWFDVERVAAGYTGVFCSLIDKVIGYDPEYFDLFWSEPGYLGADASASLHDARVQHDTTISQVVMQSEAAELGLPMSMSAMFGDSEHDMPAALRLASLPEGNLQGASLILNSGDGKGAMLHIAQVIDDLIMTGFGENNFDAMRRFKVGDEVSVDNSIYLAAQTYHRHQVPDVEEYPTFAQFCSGGEPIYPQRPEIIGMKFAQGGGGSIQSGRFAGKMIAVCSLMDETCCPWQGDWYRSRVQEALGDRLDDHYRLWFVEHAMHTSPTVVEGDPRPVRTTRAVSYAGVLQQALRDLSAWVENGRVAPASSEYEIVDGQVVIPATAAERGSIQPVVRVTANGGSRAEVAVGEDVELVAEVDVPAGTGTIVTAEWDFEGAGDFPQPTEGLDGSARHLRVATSHAFSEPGTYYPALRVASHRQGDVETPFARVLNLGRVRVVVA